MGLSFWYIPKHDLWLKFVFWVRLEGENYTTFLHYVKANLMGSSNIIFKCVCRSAHNYFLFWIHFFVWNDLMMYLCQYFLIWTCHLAQNLQIECGILKIFLFKMMRKYMKWKYSNFVFFLAYCSCVSQIGYKILKIWQNWWFSFSLEFTTTWPFTVQNPGAVDWPCRSC